MNVCTTNLDGSAVVVSSFIAERSDDINYFISHLENKRKADSVSSVFASRSKVTTEGILSLSKRKRNYDLDTRKTKSFRPFKLSKATVMKRKKKKKESIENDVPNDTTLSRKGLRRKHIFDSPSGISRLNTHVWQSKRMHMKPMYGYMLPSNSKSRGIKSCQRQVESGCTVHDMSYFTVIKLNGVKEQVINVLMAVSVSSAVY